MRSSCDTTSVTHDRIASSKLSEIGLPGARTGEECADFGMFGRSARRSSFDGSQTSVFTIAGSTTAPYLPSTSLSSNRSPSAFVWLKRPRSRYTVLRTSPMPVSFQLGH